MADPQNKHFPQIANGSGESSHHDILASSEDTHSLPISLPHPHTNSSNSVSLLSKPGMGLPVELWDAIIDFLSFAPYSLLACCLTCRSFNYLTRKRLRNLRFQILDGRPGRLITEQIQKVSTSARCIQNLTVMNSHKMGSVIILAVPFQLSTKLIHLRCLELENIFDTSSIHPSVWLLFGHTIPSVSDLTLGNINFPSFSTFIQLVLSFRSLEGLTLGYIASTQYQVRRTFLKGPIRWSVVLSCNETEQPQCVRFMEAFSRWFHLNKIKFPELIIYNYPSLCQLNYQPIKSLGAHTESLRIDEFESSRGDVKHFSRFPKIHRLFLGVPYSREFTKATARSMSNLIARTSCTLRSLMLLIKTNDSLTDTCQVLDITLFSWILAVRKSGIEPELSIYNRAHAVEDQFVAFPLVASCSLGMPHISFDDGWLASSNFQSNLVDVSQ